MAAFAKVAVLGDYKGTSITPLDVHLMGFQTANVRREWERIDVLVELPELKIIIAIELKIDAAEHGEQLSRYREKIMQHWPEHSWTHFLFFLTKHGDEPGEIERERWLPVPLEGFARELDQLVAKEVGNTDARRLLENYLSMLRRHHLKNEKLEGLASRLWAQHYDALSYLMERRPDRIGEIERGLFECRFEIASEISARVELSISVDDSSPSMLRFGVDNWDDIPGMLKGAWTSSNRIILMEVERGRSDGIPFRMRFVLGKGPKEVRQNLYEALASTTNLKLTSKASITDHFTRLTTISVRSNADNEERSIESVVELIKNAMVSYAVENLPKYDAALSALRS